MPLPLAVGIVAAISAVIVPLLIRAAVAFGFGVVVFSGLNLLLSQAESLIISQFSGFPAGYESISGILGVMQVDVFITIMLSAIATKFTIQGMTAAGTIRKII